MTDRIAEPWGERTPYAPGEAWPTRVDTHLARLPARKLRKSCEPDWVIVRTGKTRVKRGGQS